MAKEYVALVDTDVLAYKACTISEEEDEFGDGISVLTSRDADVIAAFHTQLETLQKSLKLCGARILYYVFALSSSEVYFRKAILPTYKGNRVGKRKPMRLNFIREYIANNFKTCEKPGLEADDVLGILQTNRTIIKDRTIICSSDKDLRTVPGLLFDGKDVELVTSRAAYYTHMYQTLVGDATDGYGGCYGIGPVKAKSILSNSSYGKTYWRRVLRAYRDNGYSYQECLTQARVAKICTAAEYNFTTDRVKLWSPENE